MISEYVQILKTNVMVSCYFPPTLVSKFSEIFRFLKFSYFKIPIKTLLGINFAFIQNEFELCSKLQANDLDRFPLNLGTQPYALTIFPSYIIAPNFNILNVPLLGITLPLLKMQLKLS